MPAPPANRLTRALSDFAKMVEILDGSGIFFVSVTQALAKMPNRDARQEPISEEGQDTLGEACLHRIDLSDGTLTITIDLAPLLDRAGTEQMLAPAVLVSMVLRRNGRNRPIVLETKAGAARRDADLIARVADARRRMEDLVQGRARTVAEITERERLRPGAVSRFLPLAWLAPDIATAMLEGRQPVDLTAMRLRELPGLLLDWSEQRSILGF